MDFNIEEQVELINSLVERILDFMGENRLGDDRQHEEKHRPLYNETTYRILWRDGIPYVAKTNSPLSERSKWHLHRTTHSINGIYSYDLSSTGIKKSLERILSLIKETAHNYSNIDEDPVNPIALCSFGCAYKVVDRINPYTSEYLNGDSIPMYEEIFRVHVSPVFGLVKYEDEPIQIARDCIIAIGSSQMNLFYDICDEVHNRNFNPYLMGSVEIDQLHFGPILERWFSGIEKETPSYLFYVDSSDRYDKDLICYYKVPGGCTINRVLVDHDKWIEKTEEEQDEYLALLAESSWTFAEEE